MYKFYIFIDSFLPILLPMLPLSLFSLKLVASSSLNINVLYTHTQTDSQTDGQTKHTNLHLVLLCVYVSNN